MRRAGLLLLAAVAAAGCTELVRWPDRPPVRSGSGRFDPAPEGHYVVKRGDTLYSIAFRHQLDFRDLAVWNDIGGDYLIRPGQVLRLSLPEGRATAASTSIRTVPIAPPPAAPARTEPDPAAWQWPTRGAVVRRFGEGSANKGVDIAGEPGQAVLAAAPGRVVYSGSALKGYGELIIIKHSDQYLSAYGYNRRRLVAEGDQVGAGQRIAELGLGPEQKPVLHFEIRRRGKPVDPIPLLPPA